MLFPVQDAQQVAVAASSNCQLKPLTAAIHHGAYAAQLYDPDDVPMMGKQRDHLVPQSGSANELLRLLE
jgi:hypothetical protein